MNKKTHFLTQAALIAALYVVLTLVAAMLGLASGTIQVRLSEALTILPALTPAAIPGVFVGCLLGNLLSGPFPPVLANGLIVPFVLIRVYRVEDAYWFLMLTVGIGEIISAGILGILLYNAISKTKFFRK